MKSDIAQQINDKRFDKFQIAIVGLDMFDFASNLNLQKYVIG